MRDAPVSDAPPTVLVCLNRPSNAQSPILEVPAAHEPITPVPAAPAQDPRRVALCERLFNDPRLSRQNTRSCSSCHDVRTNGASASVRDLTPEGEPLAFVGRVSEGEPKD